MTQSNITLSADVNAYFQEVVADAMRVRHVEATEAASSYLVGLLSFFAHPDEEAEATFDQPLTFALRDAMGATGKERFHRLRKLGDHVLYALGFFGSHIEGKGVDRRYVVGVGTTAYTSAASMLRLKADLGPNVLGELATKFEAFAKVLADVAEGTLACGARDERSVLRMYERWMRTGSSRLAEELTARGIVPARAPSGLN